MVDGGESREEMDTVDLYLLEFCQLIPSRLRLEHL